LDVGDDVVRCEPVELREEIDRVPLEATDLINEMTIARTNLDDSPVARDVFRL
jgi:hypothetical protein